MADNHQNKLDKRIEAGLRVNPWFDFDADAAWNEFSDAISSDAEKDIPLLAEPKPVFA
jgi:hypothetical protein